MSGRGPTNAGLEMRIGGVRGVFGGVPLLLLVTEKVPWTTGRAKPDENSRLHVSADTTVPSHHQISARWDSPRHRLSSGSAVGGVAERPRLADGEGK
jgi:hypothetical protein